jgi:hypothetical protein
MSDRDKRKKQRSRDEKKEGKRENREREIPSNSSAANEAPTNTDGKKRLKWGELL